MQWHEARADVVRAGRRLQESGLVIGTAGNVSRRVGDLLAITPSGVDYARLTPEDICLVGLDGRTVEATAPPSTELPLHLAAYRALPSISAVVHTHSTAATAVGLVLDVLPAVHYLIALVGGPIPVLPYATPGSTALAELIAGALPGRSALVLRNHGVVTVGPSLPAALAHAELVEWLASLYLSAVSIGKPSLVDDAELARVAELLAHYGEAGTEER